ncbi:unnamed protein product [Rhizophagus irregularis]|nr:unnamed protein product [Rhizophagus irregularis]
MRGNETPSDWKDRIWDTLMEYRKNHLLTDSNKRYLITRKQTYLLYQCDVWFGINIGICYSCNQLVYSKLGSGKQSVDMRCSWKMYQIGFNISEIRFPKGILDG